MRDAFTADWAFAFKGTLETNVRTACPQLLRSWPLLQSFNFEAYLLSGNYLLMILRDKLSGVPAGPGSPKPFPYSDHPSLPPTIPDIPLWQFYLGQKFGLAAADVSYLVPVHDCGRNDVTADYALFTAPEQYFWHEQFMFIFTRQKQWMESLMASTNPTVVNYHVTGPNARVNVNSSDSSTNTVLTDNTKLFGELRGLLPQVVDASRRASIATAIEEMEASAGKPTFVQHYQKFIGLAADHAGLFGALLPALAALLGA